MVTIRSIIAAIPGARRLGRKLGLVAPPPGFDDAPSRQVRRDLRRLALRNRFSRASIVDPTSTFVVTMTTHGARLRDVHVALESIARGTVLPARVILWLDEERELTASLSE